MAVRLRDGIGNVDGDSDDRTVTVEYDAAVTNPDEIRDALEQVGYPAESIVRNWTGAEARRVPRDVPIGRWLAAARGALRRRSVGHRAVCCIAAIAAIWKESR